MSKLSNLCITLTLFTVLAVPVSAHNHNSDSKPGNIVETASNAGQFNTLLAAATAAGLAPALTGEGPFTVFAPTDDAFGALPAGTIDSLLKEENRDTLVRILSYHVVSGLIGSDALADEVSLKTLAGPQVKFTASEQGFTIEGARIVATDISASNGVVHVIDRVIMPPQQLSRSDAEQMIMSAISTGAPMFNHGNHQGTVQVYTMTAQKLIDTAALSSKERQRLQQGLDESNAMVSATQSAWRLRYALDDVFNSLRGQLI